MSALAIMLSKLRRLARELGWRNAMLYLIHRVLLKTGRASLYHYYIIAQPVASAPLLHQRRGRSIVISRRPPTPDSAAFPLSLIEVELRTRRGDVCLTAYKNNVVCGYLWLCFVQFNESEVRCKFETTPADTTVWDFDLYIVPEHRLGFTFVQLWDEAYALLRERRIAWTMSRISTYNAVSWASHRRLGALRLGTATFLSIGPCQLSVATMSPFLPRSFSVGSAPVLRIRAPVLDDAV
jgi:hypothetical protein